MNWARLAALSFCAGLAMCAAQAGFAGVVVVDPNNMGNWTVYQRNAANNYTEYAFANMAPGHGTIGAGAFYARTGLGGATDPAGSGQLWLGNDQFAGTRLADITKLEYTTYTYTSGAAPSPSKNDYVRQPFQLQIAIQLTPGGDWGYLMHRPWGMIGKDHPLSYFDIWQTWDALSSNYQWYLAYNDGTTPPAGIIGTWDDILAAHPDAVLATPPPNAEPWKWRPPATCTGCSLNFEVGARKRSNAIVFGKVLWDGWDLASGTFYIDDGSGPARTVKIIAPGAYAVPDDYIAATGTLKQILWPDEIPPINYRTLTSRPENVMLVFP